VIPAIHYALAKGWIHAISKASLGWLILMGTLYILGALVYAYRIPERWFPGKCDIWVSFFILHFILHFIHLAHFDLIIFCKQGHSHQLFHLLVIAAAFVHYHGISEMAMHRLAHGECEDHPYEAIVWFS
jgi:adiponectin receptor